MTPVSTATKTTPAVGLENASNGLFRQRAHRCCCGYRQHPRGDHPTDDPPVDDAAFASQPASDYAARDDLGGRKRESEERRSKKRGRTCRLSRGLVWTLSELYRRLWVMLGVAFCGRGR